MTKTTTLDSEIKNRINSFADELASMIRQMALDSVQSALGGTAVATAPRRAAGRPSTVKAKVGRKAAPAQSSTGRRPGRPANPAVIGLMPDVISFVKSNDGAGVADIAKALKKNTEALKPVMLKLLAEKKLRKSGQKRGTKYHAR